MRKVADKPLLFVVIQSFLFAFFADLKCLNWSFVYGGYLNDGAMGALYPAVLLLILVCAITGKNNLTYRLSNYTIFIVVALIAFYALTITVVGPPRISVPMFAVFVICAYLIPSFIYVNSKIVIKAMMFFPFFAIFRLEQVFKFYSYWTHTISMDTSYGFLVPIVANVVYVFFYFKGEGKIGKIVTIALSIINLVYFYQILQYGSRGPILSVLLLVLFLWIFKWKRGNGIKAQKNRLWIGIVSVVFTVIFFFPILGAIDDAFISRGIEVHFIKKTFSLGVEGNLTNGREGIASMTMKGFYESPILGHGVDRFEANTGIIYPHNFILQALYDGGILLLLILLVPVGYLAVRKLQNCSIDELSLFSALFFSSVPGALFSGNMWNLSIMWLFFGYVCSRKTVAGEETSSTAKFQIR